MILFWVVIIVGLFFLFRYFTGNQAGIPGSGKGPDSGRRDPIEILKERYAKGEIDSREFEERKKTLEADG